MRNVPSLAFPMLLVFHEIGAYLSNDMYLSALPQLVSDLNISQHEGQLTLTLWFCGAVALQLLLGPLSDRYGRRVLLLSSGMIYVMALLTCAMTSNFMIFLFARFVQGITVSAVLVAGYASIHERYDQTQAIRILALMGSIVIIAPAFGPLVGSVVLLFGTWRWIFWILVGWATLTTFLLSICMPETNPAENRQPIHFKFLLKDYYAVITNWKFTGLSLTFCFTFAGFIAWLTAAPFLVVDRFGKTALTFGLVQAIVFVFYVIANRFVKHLMEKIGPDKLIRLGLSITLIGGILSLIFAIMFPNSLSGLVIAMTIYSFGSGLSFPPLNRLAIEASDKPMGIRMAVSSTLMSGFGMLGALTVSIVYNATLASLAYILALTIIFACLVRWSLYRSN